MKKVLTIAGSDCSGGAGIQADIKTITAHGMYAMSVITALTAQNTTGVYGIVDTPPEFVEKQLDCVFTDIFPDSVKVGMVSHSGIISAIAGRLRRYDARNIVVDPVMISTSGSALLSPEAQSTLERELLPLASVITPNLPEASALCGFRVSSLDDMKRAAEMLSERFGCAVLVKGGHLEGCADDILYDGSQFSRFGCERVDNPNTHGTGCTLSSAIACNLADGKSLPEGVAAAKAYITGALKAMLDLGKGSGPLDHTYAIKEGRKA